jgi:PAS domain S-box-containing protein
VVLVNPAAESILGLSGRDVEGRTLSSVLDGVLEDAASLPAAIYGGEPQVFKHRPPDRAPRYLEISAAVMHDADERELGTVLALRDISAKRLLENELAKTQKLESLGLLAGGIAHDFNNLLTVIQGSLDLAGMNVGDLDKQERLRAAALRATHSAGRLTQQLLTFAKGGTPQLRVVSVASVVEESVNLAMSGASARCTVELDPDLRNIEADPTQIRQVIGNILVNARQAMGEGGTIHITGRNDEPEGGRPQVVIAIRDEGEGIPESNLSRIFDPYFTTRPTGSGLGLAIVHSIVGRHGGHVDVETEVGRGTSFSIHLPATEAELEPVAEPAPRGVLAGGRILVLDDEAEIRQLLTGMLEQLGFTCVALADGRIVIDAFARARGEGKPYTAVILDLTIPGGVGGLETIERLREIDPDVRAIVSSGYSDDPVVADHRRHGFAACLAKPYTIDHLREVLVAVLGQREAESAPTDAT